MSQLTMLRAARARRPSGPVDTNLPIALSELIPRRVRLLALIFGVATLVGLGQTAAWPSAPAVAYVGFLLSSAVPLGVYFVLRGREDVRLAQRLGYTFIFNFCALAAVIEAALPQPDGIVPIGMPTGVVAAFVYVVVVPTRPTAGGALVAVSGVLGAGARLILSDGRIMQDDLLAMGHSLFVGFIFGGMTYFVLRGILRLGREVQDSREMGSYQLQEKLGAGGMGEVWKGVHRLLARPAAIKVIKPALLGVEDAAGTELLLQRFEREARATSLLTSPHIVEVHDFGITDDHCFYYVMELLDGLDLDTLVETRGPLEPARAVHVLRQVCFALADAHANGLVHRDIKPANIFVCRQGRFVDWVKVLDFGLVATGPDNEGSERLTSDTVVTGTPAFIAPEMALGGSTIDGRTDLYALGCVGYWLLTGQLVFEASRPIEMVVKHAKEAPTPPSSLAEIDIPADLETVIMRCLEKDPADRYENAEALAAALQALDVPSWSHEQAHQWWNRNRPRAPS